MSMANHIAWLVGSQPSSLEEAQRSEIILLVKEGAKTTSPTRKMQFNTLLRCFQKKHIMSSPKGKYTNI